MDEDLEYNFESSVIEPVKATKDIDSSNISIIQEVSNYLGECIATDNSLDGIDLSKDAPLTPTEQMFAIKRNIDRLRQAKSFIDSKLELIKEQSNG